MASFQVFQRLRVWGELIDSGLTFFKSEPVRWTAPGKQSENEILNSEVATYK